MIPTITISDTASAALRDAARQLRRPRPLYAAAAKEVVQTLKNWFRMRQSEGNKKRWPPQHFWFGVRNSVANHTGVSLVTNHKAVVTVADPRFAHKVTGGRVTPKRRKFLAIPLTAQAYKLSGKGTIRESRPDLFVFRIAQQLWLVRATQKSTKLRQKVRKTAKAPLEFWFRLVKSVTHKADPRALPPQTLLDYAVEKAVLIALPILLRKQFPNAS